MLWLEGIYDTQFDIFESIGKKVFYHLAVTTPLHSKVSIVCTILNQIFLIKRLHEIPFLQTSNLWELQ